ncbi:MAG: glucose-6-phosphate isomerase [Methanoculleus sp. SDB]|nr:MAG: glucose-6-phosphate isomerase [Methanoculleus sp. SDB]
MDAYWNGPLPEPKVRTMDEIRGVLADPGCRDTRSSLYLMYRACARTDEDRDWLIRHDLRFDITVIPPAVICGEYVKTKGHYHPVSPDGTEYPELYEVLGGRGIYLLQTRNLADIVAVEAKKGDIILVPPGYGHVTINPADENFVMANIVSTRFLSDYGPYETKRGAAYYYMQSGWKKNPAYSGLPPLRFRTAPPAASLSLCDGGIYGLIGRDDILACLNHPARGFPDFSVI